MCVETPAWSWTNALRRLTSVWSERLLRRPGEHGERISLANGRARICCREDKLKKTVIAVTFAALLGVSCASGPLSKYAGSWVARDFEIRDYKTIAILPVVNLTNNASADVQVPDLVAEELRELTKREFSIMDPGDVESLLRSEGLQDSVTDTTSYADLCRWLGVDNLFDTIVGVFGYERREEPGLAVPYTTYLYLRLTAARYAGLRNIDLASYREDLFLPPEARYVEVPDSVYNCATAEMQLALYDGKDGEWVFSVVDVRSSHGGTLEGVARTLIRGELTGALRHEERTAWPFFPKSL